MDPAVPLDLLGNENHRRILWLSSHKPCYVTEISEYFGVSPKTVIDHPRKLEDAGPIESRTDDQRHKYFHISRDLRLEVNVSPYGFGARSAYPPSPSLDMAGRCPHVTLEIENAGTDDVSELARELGKLEELDNELSLAQRWVQGRIIDVLDRLNDRPGVDVDSRFYAEILAAPVNRSNTVRGIAKELNADPAIVDSTLHHLAGGDLVAHNSDRWRID